MAHSLLCRWIGSPSVNACVFNPSPIRVRICYFPVFLSTVSWIKLRCWSVGRQILIIRSRVFSIGLNTTEFIIYARICGYFILVFRTELLGRICIVSSLLNTYYLPETELVAMFPLPHETFKPILFACIAVPNAYPSHIYFLALWRK